MKIGMKIEKINFLPFFPALFLFGTLFEGLPYVYFQLLRWAVSIPALFLGWKDFQKKNKFHWKTALMAVVAILFNPIEPIGMPRSIWYAIDLVTGLFFAALTFFEFYKIYQKQKQQTAPSAPQTQAAQPLTPAANAAPQTIQAAPAAVKILQNGPCSGDKDNCPLKNRPACSRPEQIFCKKLLQKCFPVNSIYPQYHVSMSGNAYSYYLDFAVFFSNGKKLGVEMDGYTTHQDKTSDEFNKWLERSNMLALDGWFILPFSWNQARTRTKMCQDMIEDAKKYLGKEQKPLAETRQMFVIPPISPAAPPLAVSRAAQGART